MSALETGGEELPQGLKNALMQNRAAMDRFLSLTEVERRDIIDGTRRISSRDEMRNYVSSILQTY
ncbi:MAG: hypothetical protein IJC58_03685 [Oscillospiraceae bacterium]|nr:hypothetical protein [Oscillospiraceae bacterium]